MGLGMNKPRNNPYHEQFSRSNRSPPSELNVRGQQPGSKTSLAGGSTGSQGHPEV